MLLVVAVLEENGVNVLFEELTNQGEEGDGAEIGEEHLGIGTVM